MNKMNKFAADAVDIADLIADMALKGATREELERITRYSIAVIDASKEFNVADLVVKYRDDSSVINESDPELDDTVVHDGDPELMAFLNELSRKELVNSLCDIYMEISELTGRSIRYYDEAIEEIHNLYNEAMANVLKHRVSPERINNE